MLYFLELPSLHTSIENTVFPFSVKVNYKVYIVRILYFVDNNSSLLFVDLGIKIENDYEILMERLKIGDNTIYYMKFVFIFNS